MISFTQVSEIFVLIATSFTAQALDTINLPLYAYNTIHKEYSLYMVL
jgi:hypothetical protein